MYHPKLGKYKGRVIPASIRPPTNKITISDFTPRRWACVVDKNINRSEQANGLSSKCKYLHNTHGCDSCAFNFNYYPELFLEWLVENDSISKELALQVLLMELK